MFAGCGYHGPKNHYYKHWNLNPQTWNPDVEDTLNMVIVDIADQLVSQANLVAISQNSVAVTSFVDLHNLNKTTEFGRILGESMFNELYIRGINVADFRGRKALIVNAQGEYFISRDINMIKDTFYNKFVLVGTYSRFGPGYTINARIVNNTTGKVVASARALYHINDDTLLENCENGNCVRSIKIVTDHCSKVECPTNCLTKICK